MEELTFKQLDGLTRLLAREAIHVRTSSTVETAHFNLANRTIMLPVYSFESMDLQLMIRAHEIGHALHTPPRGFHGCDADYRGALRSVVNVIEDARIERLMKEEFPGLIPNFALGYKKLFDIWKIKDRLKSEMNLVDRINLFFKFGGLATGVSFTKEEQILVNRTSSSISFEEVVEIAKDCVKFMGLNEPAKSSPAIQKFPATVPSDGLKEPLKELSKEEDESVGSSYDLKEEQPEENSSTSSETEDGSGFDAVGENLTPEEFLSDVFDELMRESQEPTAFAPAFDVCTTEYDLNNENAWSRLSSITIDASLKHRVENTMRENAAWRRSVLRAKQEFVCMRRDFGLLRAANKEARTRISSNGSLNANKLYSHSFNDDIFRRIETKPNGNNHALLLMVDFSGSMDQALPAVAEKLYSLALFCKSERIPFEVYCFTDCYDNGNSGSHLNQLALLKFLHDGLTPYEIETRLYKMTRARYSLYGLKMLGTPLLEAQFASIELARRLEKRSSAQFTRVAFITDGAGSHYTPHQKTFITINDKNSGMTSISKVNDPSVSVLRLLRAQNRNPVNFFIGKQSGAAVSFANRSANGRSAAADPAFYGPAEAMHRSYGVGSVTRNSANDFGYNKIFFWNNMTAEVRVESAPLSEEEDAYEDSEAFKTMSSEELAAEAKARNAASKMRFSVLREFVAEFAK